MRRRVTIYRWLFLMAFAFLVNDAGAQKKKEEDLDFSTLLLPAGKSAVFTEAGFFVWCGTIVKGDDGRFHLFYSRWPKAKGFNAWVTDSEVAHAVADNPLGPYKFQNVALPKRDKKFWDADVTHNPTVMKFGTKYYLYYMGNYGDGTFWNHRNHQRIGVAVADNVAGPWKRFDGPVLDVTSNAWDHLMTSNPSVTKGRDENYLMVYKGVANGTLPKGGKVSHGVAVSKTPIGPFVKQPKTVFDAEGASFAAEDPFVWTQGSKYYAIVKDMRGAFTNAGPSLALFESTNGLDWKTAQHPLVSGLTIRWDDGTAQKVQRLERPQLWLKEGKPTVLFVAVKESDSITYNLAISLNTKY